MDTAYYLQQIARIQAEPDCTFLWGPVRNALLQEYRHGGIALLHDLCVTNQPFVKEMMVSVLSELGRDMLAPVEGLLEEFLPPARPATSRQNAWRLLHPPRAAPEVPTQQVQKLAIEVASNLKLGGILHTAALHPDPTIRANAVRYIYYLWQRDPAAGYAVLQQIAETATGTRIPHAGGLEVLVGVSLVIFFDHPQDPTVLGPLQTIWRGIIDRTLALSGSRWSKMPRDFLREQIFSLVITVLFRLLQGMPPYNPINYPDMEAFFQRTPQEKALYERLVQYVDVAGPYSQEQMERDFFEIITIRDTLMESTLNLVLPVQMLKAPSTFLPLLKKLFAAALADPQPSPYLSALLNVPVIVLNRDHTLDDVFEFMVYGIAIVQTYYAEHPQIPGLHRRIVGPAAMYLGPYILLQYKRIGTAKTEWLKTRVDTALREQNMPFFELMLKQEFPVVGCEQRHPESALDALTLFLHSGNEQIDHLIWDFLARLRVLYPDQVETFLEGQTIPEKARLYIRTQAPAETIGQLIGTRTYELVIDVVCQSPALRRQIIGVLAQAPRSKNTRDWLMRVLREVVNRIYGGEALRPASSKDPREG
jgi:hypothetical protein